MVHTNEKLFFKDSFTRAIEKQISNTTPNGNYTVTIFIRYAGAVK